MFYDQLSVAEWTIMLCLRCIDSLHLRYEGLAAIVPTLAALGYSRSNFSEQQSKYENAKMYIIDVDNAMPATAQ